MKQLCLLASLFLVSLAQAQEKTYVVNPGQKINEVITPSEMYTFPAFGQGTVYFNDGTNAAALMNYNAAYGEVQFIDPKGDTLSLADEKRISMVVINTDTFYYENGYVQLLARAGEGRLERRTVIRQSGSAKTGLYGQDVQGGAASSYSVLSSGAHDANLTVSQKTTFKKETAYYFADDRGRLQPVSRKSAEKVFGSKKTVIADYLSKNKVDFKSESDLRAFVAYLSTH